ncbi:MAG: MFS transporter [Proteobacteria bacterium]|nr:MFS transporter [Pseudomonadota bacterium]
MDIILLIGVLVTVGTIIPVITQMKNHPRGLIICFFAEMWERFSYYGMRALLIYYVTSHFLFQDERASHQYGSYTTLVYLLPLVGGIVADRWLGTRKAIVFGGLLLVAGHFGMAFEGKPNQQTLIYQGNTYEFVDSKAKKEGAKKELVLKVGDQTYQYGPNKEGGLEVQGLPKDAPIPSIMPKGTYELSVKSETPWAEKAFFLSISLIIMGVGFLKPNISTIVGQLYPDKDPRRDAGFQLYYYGINLGAFWAAILCGLLGQKVGWWAGFGLAGFGMLLGLVLFMGGKKHLEGKGEPPAPTALKEKVGGIISRENLIYACGLLGVTLVFFIVQRNELVGRALAAGSIAVLAYVFYSMRNLTKQENFRLLLALLLTLGSVVFFTLFEQAGSSLSLFAERNSSMNILPAPFAIEMFGKQFAFASSEQLALLKNLRPDHILVNMGIAPAQTQSFNAGFILIFAPIFSAIFTYLGRKQIDPDPVKKFAFGMVCVGLGFLILVWGKGAADSAFRLPLIFLFLTYLFHTWGELALSPVGLSQQTKLSPPFLASTMMAIWFLGSAAAQFVGGIIAGHASTETVGGVVLDNQDALETSLKTFQTIGMWGIYIGIGFFILSFFVSKWAYGANDTNAE